MPPASSYTVDTSDVLPTLKALQGVEKDIRDNANRRLREAAGKCADGLVRELKPAAAAAATPQAALVVRSARTRRDRIPVVVIGGRMRVGRYGAPAAALVWGSERGGTNFAAPRGGAYWVRPTVARYSAGPAVETYKQGVAQILRDAGL